MKKEINDNFSIHFLNRLQTDISVLFYRLYLKGRHSFMSFEFDFDELGIRQRKKCSSKSLYIADEVIAGIEEIASMTNSSFNNVATSMLETQLKILQEKYKNQKKKE